MHEVNHFRPPDPTQADVEGLAAFMAAEKAALMAAGGRVDRDDCLEVMLSENGYQLMGRSEVLIAQAEEQRRRVEHLPERDAERAKAKIPVLTMQVFAPGASKEQVIDALKAARRVLGEAGFTLTQALEAAAYRERWGRTLKLADEPSFLQYAQANAWDSMQEVVMEIAGPDAALMALEI